MFETRSLYIKQSLKIYLAEEKSLRILALESEIENVGSLFIGLFWENTPSRWAPDVMVESVSSR